MYSFLDKIAQQIYAERRFELEKALGLHNAGACVSKKLGRFRVCDAAGPVFTFRMGAGFPGDVNRTHPVSILPCLIDSNAPPTAYGQAVVVDPTTQGVRPLVAGDSGLTDVYGVTVRPYPLQQNSVNPAFGSGTPPTTGIIDVCNSGFITVVLGDGTLTGALKGGTVYIWYATSTGHHVQGGFEASNTGGSTLALTFQAALFNGVQDGSGFVELQFHQP